MRLLLVILFVLPLCAQSRSWWLSAGAYAGAQAADAACSWQRPEANPLLRLADGRFAARGVAIKSALTGAVILGEWLVLRRKPHAGKSLAWANWGLAAAVSAVAARNRAAGAHGSAFVQ